MTSLAFGYRTVALSTYGLSEDEVNKVRAIEQYRHGHFGANAEHPMLMKLAMWGSVELAGVWNHVAPTGQTVPIESALRLPNVIAGTLTTLVLFGLAELLFGTPVAFVASLLWALDVNAITINRIGKRKRTRTGFGQRAATKRAIVTLAEGDRIDIFGGPTA